MTKCIDRACPPKDCRGKLENFGYLKYHGQNKKHKILTKQSFYKKNIFFSKLFQYVKKSFHKPKFVNKGKVSKFYAQRQK